MAIKLRKSYRFALRSSSIVSLTLTLVLLAIQYLTHSIEWVVLLSFLGISFLVTFIIIQLRVEKFIYRRIKKIYDEVS
ncbi:MAG: sensor histidine kinase, partial [Flavobacteriaceae bacterium]